MQACFYETLIADWRLLAEKHRDNADLHARFTRLADQLQSILDNRQYNFARNKKVHILTLRRLAGKDT